MSERLRDIADRQRKALAELEDEIKSIENSDLSKENTLLKTRLEKLTNDFEAERDNAKKLSDQNTGLKNALHEQIYNEKLSILGASASKLDIYFKSSYTNGVNRLTELENSIKGRIDTMNENLRKNDVDINDEIYQKLDELSAHLNWKITQAKEELARHSGAFSPNERAEFEKLKNDQITDEQILAVTKKNNMERFIGLNVLNAVGIFLIIIGVITVAHFTYTNLSDTLKGVMMFALGGLMLAGGEFLNRKKANVFSLGVTAGGIGVLFTALAISYFGLEILGMYPAIGLCVLITAVAFLLSTRYHSQTIAAFALIGGYLPLLSISDITTIYGAMVYFVILNVLALSISFYRKWNITAFIGLFLNIAGTSYIVTLVRSYMDYQDAGFVAGRIITLLYVIFAFVIYTLIPVIGTYRSRLKFKASDVVLLAINTFFSSLIMYGLFYMFDFEDFTGILAIVFAVIYLSLGRIIEKKFAGEEKIRALFYLTGFAFVVLIIPFQFGRAWLSLGWLAEGVALTAYGILKNEKTFKKMGFIINALCLWAFVCFDFVIGGEMFAYKYLAVTLGSLAILGAYMYKRTLSSEFQKIYKYLTIINVWFYTIYISFKLMDQVLDNLTALRLPSFQLTSYLAIALTFAVAYAASRVKILSDAGTKIISVILHVVGVLWLMMINSGSPAINYSYTETLPLRVTVIGNVILVVICLLSVLAVRDVLRLTVMGQKMGVEWYPLILSGYAVFVLTQNLIVQYNLAFASAWISIIYVVTALAWIVFGFMKRYSYIRKFGLGLSILAVIKLFIIDLWHLTLGYKILSYFALGITLISISFVYQYFSKRFELQGGGGEIKVDFEENN